MLFVNQGIRTNKAMVSNSEVVSANYNTDRLCMLVACSSPKYCKSSSTGNNSNNIL